MSERDFDNLFTAMYTPLYYFAQRLVRDGETARDIVNDAFEYLWKNIASADETTVRTLLYTIVRSRSIDHLRRQSSREQYAAHTAVAAQRYVEMAQTEPDERLSSIHTAMERLTPYCRNILQECYVNGKKYKEVVDELNVSVAAVHKNIVKALRTIRETVGKKG